MQKPNNQGIETVIHKMTEDFKKLLDIKKKLDSDVTLEPEDNLPEFLIIRSRENDVESAQLAENGGPPLDVVVAGEPAFLAAALHAVFSTFMNTSEISKDIRCEVLTGLLLELSQRSESRMLVINALKNVNECLEKQMLTEGATNSLSPGLRDKITAKENSGIGEILISATPPKDKLH